MTDTLMRVAIVDGPGASLRVENRPIFVPGPTEALVRIAAGGVNPLDLKIAAGQAAHARQADLSFHKTKSSGKIDLPRVSPRALMSCRCVRHSE